MSRRIVRGSAGAATPLVVNLATMGFDSTVTLRDLGIVLPKVAKSNDVAREVKDATVKVAPVKAPKVPKVKVPKAPKVKVSAVKAEPESLETRERRAEFREARARQDAARAESLAKMPRYAASLAASLAKYGDHERAALVIAESLAHVREQESHPALDRAGYSPVDPTVKLDAAPPRRVESPDFPDWYVPSVRQDAPQVTRRSNGARHTQRVRNDSHGSAQSMMARNARQ